MVEANILPCAHINYVHGWPPTSILLVPFASSLGPPRVSAVFYQEEDEEDALLRDQ